MVFIFALIISLIISALATIFFKNLSWRLGAIDLPAPQAPRKIHKRPIPLWGGLAVIISFDLISAFYYFFSSLLSENIPFRNMLAIWLGSLALGFVGIIDDKKNLRPVYSFLGPLLATLIVIFFGITVPHVTNPFGGQIILPVVKGVTIVSGVLVFVWILGMIYTTKLLDGVDGLASGIGTIAALALFALSFTPQVKQSYTALLAIIAAGCFLGFLIFNWHPARIFLGESGSTFIGFVLGVLAIIAGGKMATAFLVMGVPILDSAWVILRRLLAHESPFQGDADHLHFRLLRLGFNQRQTVILLMSLAVVFGGLAVFLQTLGKFLALSILLTLMIVFGHLLITIDHRKAKALQKIRD